MKTLAVIKNELFKDYVKIVSTDNLEKTLDNPDVPLPFTCVESAVNNNSDLLANQLSTYFQQAKLKNKDFYSLDSQQLSQLQFMVNLIKISSGDTTTSAVVEHHEPQAVEAVSEIKEKNSEPTQEPVVAQPVLEEPAHVEVAIETPLAITESPATETVNHLHDNIAEEFDPFTFEPVIESKDAISTDTKDIEKPDSGEMVERFGIAKNSTLHFFKNDSVTAQLVDDNHVVLNGATLTFVDAAKAAFKTLGMIGMASGLGNWLYHGQSLKELQK